MVFFRFYLSLIGNYISFYKGRRGSKVASAKRIFSIDLYLDSLKETKRGFMEEMIKTQMAATFIEKSYSALTSHNELSYFVKGVRTLQNGTNAKLEEDLANIYSVCMHNFKHVLLPVIK